MADTSLHTRRELQERLNIRNAADEERRKEAVKSLSLTAGQLKTQINLRTEARADLLSEQEVTRSVIDSTAARMDKAMTNLHDIEGVPNLVSSLLSIVAPEKWSRRYQRISVQQAGIKLDQQKSKLSIANKALEVSRTGVQQSLTAIGAIERLTEGTDIEIREAIALEGRLRDKEIAEKTREMEGLSASQIDSELKKGDKSNFAPGRLEERRDTLVDRNLARQTVKLALEVNNLGLANIYRKKFFDTLSINELDDTIGDMIKSGEKFIEPEHGLKISLEELKKLRVAKQSAVTLQGELFVKDALAVENAKTGSIVYNSQVKRAVDAGVITAEQGAADLRFSSKVFSGALVPGGAATASEAIDKRIAELEKVRKEFLDKQPKTQRAVWKRWLDTGKTVNDADNANWVAYEMLGANIQAPPRFGTENIYNSLSEDASFVMREALTGSTGQLNIDTFGIQDALSALAKQTGKADLSTHLQNAVDQLDLRKAHASIMGGRLLTSAIKELARTSPQFAKLLTVDGENLRQEFISGDTIDSDRILSVLAIAEVSQARTGAADPPNIEVSYVAALIEKVRNPNFKGDWSTAWNNAHSSLVEQSFIMFLTGGNVLRGVDSYNRDLQDRGAAAVQHAIGQADSDERQARSMAKAVEIIRKEPDPFAALTGGGS